MTFTLYHHGSSVCAAKVRFAMAEIVGEFRGVIEAAHRLDSEDRK